MIMNYYKLSKNHKKWFLINKGSIILLLIVMFFIGLSLANVNLPTVEEKLSVTFGVVIAFGLLLLAIMNRLNIFAKFKFMPFLVLFILSLSLKSVIDAVVWSSGLMIIPLVIDDCIFTPIWNNIWYNEYDN